MSELSLNCTRFLNRSAVREFLLEHAKQTRAHKYTRVSEETLIEANEVVRQWVVRKVSSLPSCGRTI